MSLIFQSTHEFVLPQGEAVSINAGGISLTIQRAQDAVVLTARNKRGAVIDSAAIERRQAREWGGAVPQAGPSKDLPDAALRQETPGEYTLVGRYQSIWIRIDEVDVNIQTMPGLVKVDAFPHKDEYLEDELLAAFTIEIRAANSMSPALAIDEQEASTLLAALVFYLMSGFDDPTKRPIQIHELACLNTHETSLDYAGIQRLQQKLAQALPDNDTPEEETA